MIFPPNITGLCEAVAHERIRSKDAQELVLLDSERKVMVRMATPPGTHTGAVQWLHTTGLCVGERDGTKQRH